MFYRDVEYLWINRSRPCSIKKWIQRFYELPSLLVMMYRSYNMKIRGAKIGKMVSIGDIIIEGNLKNLTIDNGASLGRCTIVVHDKVYIGSNAVISDGAKLLTASHDLLSENWNSICKPIIIGEYSWVAVNSIVLPGVSIGFGSVVAAGSVVSKSLPRCSVAYGSPAIVIENRRSAMLNYCPAKMTAAVFHWI